MSGATSGISSPVSKATGAVATVIVTAVTANPVCNNCRSSTNRLPPVLSFLCIITQKSL